MAPVPDHLGLCFRSQAPGSAGAEKMVSAAPPLWRRRLQRRLAPRPAAAQELLLLLLLLLRCGGRHGLLLLLLLLRCGGRHGLLLLQGLLPQRLLVLPVGGVRSLDHLLRYLLAAALPAPQAAEASGRGQR